MAAMLIVPMWAFWHTPFFGTLSTYRGFGPMQYVGFVFGLGCGSVILTWLYNRSDQSILIVAIWHATYNLVGGATDATQGTIAAVVTTAVIIQALTLIALELRARHHGLPSVIGPVTGDTDAPTTRTPPGTLSWHSEGQRGRRRHRPRNAVA